VKYLILVYSNPTTRGIWEGFSDAQRAEGWRAHAALTEELAAAGELIRSEALADPSLGKRITVREGRTLATDGPFAEAKEALAGFYLIDCEGIERPMPAQQGLRPGGEDAPTDAGAVLPLGRRGAAWGRGRDG
jgi:hypothetical protein